MANIIRPCDCKSMQDVFSLEETGIGFNQYKIDIDSIGVLLSIDPHVAIKIPHKKFKAFSEWYLGYPASPDTGKGE